MKRNKDRWSALSMKDRAALIDIYVKSGITDLGEIRKDYNSFGNGGDVNVEELEPSIITDYTSLKEEAKKARDWVFDYYKSDGYKSRALAGGISKRNPMEKHLGIFPKKKMHFLEDYSVDSSYNWLNPVIGLKPSEGYIKGDHNDAIGWVTAHEFAHYNKMYNSAPKRNELAFNSPYYGYYYGNIPQNFLDSLAVHKYADLHDSEYNESYSDLIGLRYLLDKHGIFNSKDANAVFDETLYDKVLEDERFKENRFLKLHNKKQVINAINDVAQNRTNKNRLDYVNPDNIAAFGGKLNLFETGGPTENNKGIQIPGLTEWFDTYVDNNTKFSTVPEAPIDENELVKRQAWAESAGNDRAGSHKGAKGRYQIMPDTLAEYQKVTGDIGDIYDPVYNRRVRDWEFNRYKNSDQVNRGEPTDSVKMGRRLAIYNYGYGNTRKALNRADSLGINTDTSFDWLQEFPKETQDYVNFILRGKNTSAHRTNSAYKNRKK